MTGGKDGAVCLWNESFQNRLKTYHLQSDALEGGARLTFDLPAVRALCLGEGKILVGTKNSEVRVFHNFQLWCPGSCTALISLEHAFIIIQYIQCIIICEHACTMCIIYMYNVHVLTTCI